MNFPLDGTDAAKIRGSLEGRSKANRAEYKAIDMAINTTTSIAKKKNTGTP